MLTVFCVCCRHAKPREAAERCHCVRPASDSKALEEDSNPCGGNI